VVYYDASELWLYDIPADASRRLTHDGDSRFERAPAFVTGSCLVFGNSEPSTIELLDLAGGARRTIVEEAGARLDVSPDGTSIVYLQIDHNVDSTYRLKRVDIHGGVPDVLHTFHPNIGRGAGSEDEVSVAWAPDGSTILVANTHESTRQNPYGAIYLFDRSGREIRGKWAGTHPRWAPDGRSIYYRDHAGLSDGQRWHALDVRTMQTTTLGIRPGTNNLEVSPNGKWVAYDTSWFGDKPLGTRTSDGAPNVFAYNLTTGRERLLKRGALGPLWLSSADVAVTNATERGRHSLSSWESLGTVTRVSLGADRTRLHMTSTIFEVDVYLGP
jgi:Tol biopolymer transport system component